MGGRQGEGNEERSGNGVSGMLKSSFLVLLWGGGGHEIKGDCMGWYAALHCTGENMNTVQINMLWKKSKIKNKKHQQIIVMQENWSIYSGQWLLLACQRWYFIYAIFYILIHLNTNISPCTLSEYKLRLVYFNFSSFVNVHMFKLSFLRNLETNGIFFLTTYY